MSYKKTLMITGGIRGIGYGIAKRFAADGYNVAIMDILDPKDYQDNLNELKTLNPEYIFLQGSTTKAEDRNRFVSMTVEKFGHIDVLVNNAGVAPKVRLDMLETTEESFDYVVGTNLKGTLFMTQAVARQMIRQDYIGKRKGVIINMGSASATVSSPNRVEYCVSKAGVAMLTKVAADRLAGEGILVHEVRPGVIDTDMTRVVHEKYTKMIENGLFPIRRWGYPEDVANVVSLMCDERYDYTTGNYIDVDGGFHIQKL